MSRRVIDEAVAMARLNVMRKRRMEWEAKHKAASCGCLVCTAKRTGQSPFSALLQAMGVQASDSTPDTPPTSTTH